MLPLCMPARQVGDEIIVGTGADFVGENRQITF
jgi:hypothetical protein